MDAFELGVLAFIAFAVIASCLAARAGAGRQLGDFGGRRRQALWSPEALAERDREDLADMLAVTNERRRARGLPERSLADAIREFGGE